MNSSFAAISAIFASSKTSVVVSSSLSASSSIPVAARRAARLCFTYAARTAESDSPRFSIDIPIMRSSRPSVIPRTPVELRPAKIRISGTGNLMQRPR